jgi:hypothetical protein
MLPHFLTRVSSIVLLCLIVFLVLEYFPPTGIYLMFLGGPLLAGLLVHVFFASLLVEALTGRIPRAFVIVPIVAYGGYYAAYFWEGLQIERIAEQLRTTNPGKVYDFDPAANSLVMAGAQVFVQAHDVPVVYEPNTNFPEGYLSARLLPQAQCGGIKRDTQNRVFTFGVIFNGAFQQNVCLLRFPERPTNNVVTVTLLGDPQMWAHHKGIRQQTTQISVGDKTIGSFTTGYVWRLPTLPFLAVGCALNSAAPSWECGAEFMRTLKTIDGIPDTIDRAKFDEPVSVMLGIRKYVAADLANFTGFESNAQALDSVHKEPEKVENDVFNTLDAIIDGQNPTPPFNLGYSLATNPERLAPHAEGMASRFVALVHAATPGVKGQGSRGAGQPGPRVTPPPNARLQIEALAVAIGALPHPAFVSVAGPLFDLIKEDPDRAMRSYPMIYVRMGEAGAMTLPFYRDQIVAKEIKGWTRMFPVLALCRIGEADADLIEELKKRYNSVDLQGGGDPVNYKTALFVTLLKLGQDSFLRDNHPDKSERDKWYGEVLAGKGLTPTGPNNCMPQDWPFTIYATPEVAPSLKLSGNGWGARKN